MTTRPLKGLESVVGVHCGEAWGLLSTGAHWVSILLPVPLGWEVSTAVGTGEEPAWRLTGFHFLLQTLPKTGSSPNL